MAMIWYTFHYSVKERKRKIFWKIISNQCFTCFSTMVWVCLIVNQYSPSVIFGVPSCMCAVPWMRIHGFKLGCIYAFRIKIMFYQHFRCLSFVSVVWSGVKWKCQWLWTSVQSQCQLAFQSWRQPCLLAPVLLCTKWHGAWLYGVHRTHGDGGSFMWHQPRQRM